ncbi:hypothetical protein OIDMADRAFT_125975 [Oidiodendron maius Zn]|uniref:Heterokaryon incompatibility domain-containing protein n=1 Tax=Oidiodendron maius (strain Zn) TaxID=913774 RepID=A0A0C3GUU6_OIDMZ|nr:hypothetical protein OIDMADRAFT_125975 [Oidiodendron maius Zn]
MAKIYGQANRVIVYLGEAADDSDQALEDIRVAAEDDSVNSSNNRQRQSAIFKLLERPWFRRIWVLQEVAAARRILIMCGSVEMSGYAFCSGLNKLQLSYDAYPGLQSLTRSATYLIRGAIFRPKYGRKPPGRLSLGELIDMYHTREATERHDKVYALLGMSSDDPSGAVLSPNYTLPWKELLQGLVKYILSKEVSVVTWNEMEIAVIKSKGYILGRVLTVEADNARYDRQHVKIAFNNTPSSLEYGREFGDRWTLKASAKSIQQGDFICLLQEASKPTIIRAFKDHFAVIIMAVTFQQSKRAESDRQTPLSWNNDFTRDLLLVWDWEKSAGLQGRAGYESSVEINTLVPEYLETASNKVARLRNMALALGDSKQHEEAEMRVREAIESCGGAFEKDNLHMLAGIDSLALECKNQGEWERAERLFLQVIRIRKCVQGFDHKDTLNSIANLASTYIYQHNLWTGRQGMMASLTDRIRDNVQITEEDVAQVAQWFDERMIVLLLDLKRDNFPVNEVVVKAAARNKSGDRVMKILLEQRGDEIKITEEIVKVAAENGQSDGRVMKVLLDQRGDEIKITEEIVKAAAKNEASGDRAMKILLKQRGDEVKITEEIVKAAAENWESGGRVVKVLLEQRGYEIKITEEIVKAAANNKAGGDRVMKVLLDQRGDEIKITEEIVKAAARNEWRGEWLMNLLLGRHGDEVKITEDVVMAAVRNKWSGKWLNLLLGRRGDKLKITEELVKVVARSGRSKDVALLLDRRGDEVQITEDVVMAAARNEWSGDWLMNLLLGRRGDEVEITEELIKVVARSGRSKDMALLLSRRREGVKITEDIVKAAVESKQDPRK